MLALALSSAIVLVICESPERTLRGPAADAFGGGEALVFTLCHAPDLVFTGFGEGSDGL